MVEVIDIKAGFHNLKVEYVLGTNAIPVRFRVEAQFVGGRLQSSQPLKSGEWLIVRVKPAHEDYNPHEKRQGATKPGGMLRIANRASSPRGFENVMRVVPVSRMYYRLSLWRRSTLLTPAYNPTGCVVTKTFWVFSLKDLLFVR